MTPQVIVVTGTGTDVGKTIAVAALAAVARAAGLRVGVCKAAQTGAAPGEAADLACVQALAGEVATREPVRYPEPLAPEVAARRAGMPALRVGQVSAAVRELAADADVIVVEGAGGVLVRLAPGLTVIDVIAALDADGFAPSTLVVADPGLGTLNHTELTVEALARRGHAPSGIVIGTWPERPDLAMTCNRDDLQRLTGVPVVGAVPAGAGAMPPADFQAAAPVWFAPDVIRRRPEKTERHDAAHH
ncbi:dethiobiotin synthase [Gordonia zhaorongruii]|uniref:dethiobiotin synthase n=1 Tax=Gordonia zhaorongruii TaxID=2597659 RepID=UPI00104A93CB|nr:dethiobiotin synthase [Gordonia zhaorongruii]